MKAKISTHTHKQTHLKPIFQLTHTGPIMDVIRYTYNCTTFTNTTAATLCLHCVAVQLKLLLLLLLNKSCRADASVSQRERACGCVSERDSCERERAGAITKKE